MSLLDWLINEDILGRDAGAGTIPKSTVAKREVYIAIRRDGSLGDGTRKNPYDGSFPERLDRILNGDFDTSLRSPIRFVFGPGIFRTAGSVRNADDSPRFWAGVFSGQEFVGSGIFATTLRLEIADPLENAGYGVFGMFGNQRPSNILVQDMTVDCDLQNQPPTGRYGYARIMTHCAGIYGSQIRFKRVRVINYGTRATDFEYDYVKPRGEINGLEGFPIYINTQQIDSGNRPNNENSVIEDCIVEQPFLSNARETTCLHIGGGTISDSLYRTFNDHAVIRNCLVDCAHTGGDPCPEVPVQLLVFEATQARLSTLTQHDLRKGDRVRIRGAGAYDSIYNVLGDPIDQWTVLLQFSGSPGTPTGNITAQKATQAAMRVALSCAYNAGGNYSVVTVSCEAFHNRVVGDWVHITGAIGSTLAENYNGTFQITALPNNTTFEFILPGNDPGTASGEIWLDKVPRVLAAIKKIEVFDETLRLTTATPAFKKPGDYVHIRNIWGKTNTSVPDVQWPAGWTTTMPLNGYFEVRTVETNAGTPYLNYRLTCGPTKWISLLEAEEVWDDWSLADEFNFDNVETSLGSYNASISTHFQGFGAFSHRQGMYHNNRVLNVSVGVYGDTGSDYDLTILKNYFYKVTGPVSFPISHIASADRNGKSEMVGSQVKITRVEAGLNAPHELETDDTIIIDVNDGTGAKELYATVQIIDANSLFVNNPTIPIVSPPFTASNYLKFRPLCKRKAHIIDRNIMELNVPVRDTGWGSFAGYSYGVSLGYLDYGPDTPGWTPYVHTFGKLKIDGNYIRLVGNQADPQAQANESFGMTIADAEVLMVSNNIIDLAKNPTNGIRFRVAEALQAFNNRQSDGTLVSPVFSVNGQVKGPHYFGLEDLVEFAAVMSTKQRA